jgi:cytochrome c biogenesis protein CcmG/thiol:disulfide interchange protein DsbE
MWKFILPVAVFIGLAVLFTMGLNPNRDIHALPSPLIGKVAPDFTLTDVLDPSRKVSNLSLKGQVYVLNVWATWCGACRAEHETLLAIAARHEVPLIGLDWNDDRDRAQLLLRQLGNPYQATAFDGEGRTAIDWGVYGAPETYLVDAQGRVIFKHIAPMTEEVWRKEFAPRIAAARTAASRGGA